MSFDPYTDREFIADCVTDINARLDQLIALLKELVKVIKKDKGNG